MTELEIARVLRAGGRKRVVVFGDFCLDKYLYIDARRDEPSVETGLTAFQVVRKRLFAGAAGTITNNLRALGAEVVCVGILGEDGEGFELRRCLERVGADVSAMLEVPDRCTAAYTKPMRCENGRETEMNRLDFKNFSTTPMDVQRAALDALRRVLPAADAVLVCDQFLEPNCGMVTAWVREQLAGLANEYPKTVFYADSRAFIDGFENVLVKCNHAELARMFDVPEETVTPETTGRLARALDEKTRRGVVVTLGERGAVAFDGTRATHIPARRVSPPLDICGAGDAANAGIVFALTHGLPLHDAVAVGNLCSALVIRQIGVTGTADFRDVLRILEDPLGGESQGESEI